MQKSNHVRQLAFALLILGGVLVLAASKGSADIRGKDGATIHAKSGSKVIADKGVTVYAEGNSQVTANAGSIVHAHDKSLVTVNGAATVHAEGGCIIHLNADSSVNALSGPTVHYCEGASLLAFGTGIKTYKDSVVEAKKGSVIEAFSGATVYACDGSKVTAKSGSTVYATASADIDAEKGSTVNAVASEDDFPSRTTFAQKLPGLISGRWLNEDKAGNPSRITVVFGRGTQYDRFAFYPARGSGWGDISTVDHGSYKLDGRNVSIDGAPEGTITKVTKDALHWTSRFGVTTKYKRIASEPND